MVQRSLEGASRWNTHSPIAVAGTAGNNNPLCSSTQEGVPATSSNLDGPYGVAVDPDGNLYIANTSCGRVRMVHNGLIGTIAGNPVGAALGEPRGIAVGPGNVVYVGERVNQDVLALVPPEAQIFNPSPGAVLPIAPTFSWFGGPSNAQYELDISDKIGPVGQGDIFVGSTIQTSLQATNSLAMAGHSMCSLRRTGNRPRRAIHTPPARWSLLLPHRRLCRSRAER
jgi:DNA-binding beta-propeller fold protein YncE